MTILDNFAERFKFDDFCRTTYDIINFVKNPLLFIF